MTPPVLYLDIDGVLNDDPPVLYLDIDGVLNDDAWILSPERVALHASAPGATTPWERLVACAADDIRPHLAARVRRIVEATGARVIVCSTWRIHHTVEDLRRYLAPHGIPVHGVTRMPRGLSDYGHRVGGILDHVSTLDPGTRWCVLDDQVDETDVGAGRCVTPSDGVTEEDADRVIAILSGGRLTA